VGDPGSIPRLGKSPREGQGEWGRQHLIDNGQGFFPGEKQESSDSGYKRIPKRRKKNCFINFT